MKLPRFKELLEQTEAMTHTPPPGQMVGPTKAAVLKAVDTYKDKLRSMGINLHSNLGSGANGFVYDMSDGKVAKITKDRTEANATYRIKGKRLKNVYEIYEVFELGDLGIFLIIQEKLQPLNPIIEKYWTPAQTALGGFRVNPSEASRTFDKYWIALERHHSFPSMDSTEYLESKRAFLEVGNGLKELQKNEIKWHDWHIGNIMQKSSGAYSIIDLGVSQSPMVSIDKI